MVQLLRYEDAVDLGHGRGRASGEAAASIRRIDAQLGRTADINEAWRSPEQANANYARWVAYQNGTGPKAPLALPASESIHCRGYAADSDDWYDAAAAQVWRDNGWRQTARYPGTNRDEPWHGEYFREHDKFYGQPAAGNSKPARPIQNAPQTIEDLGEEMFIAIMPNGEFLIIPMAEGKYRAVVLPANNQNNATRGELLKFDFRDARPNDDVAAGARTMLAQVVVWG